MKPNKLNLLYDDSFYVKGVFSQNFCIEVAFRNTNTLIYCIFIRTKGACIVELKINLVNCIYLVSKNVDKLSELTRFDY